MPKLKDNQVPSYRLHKQSGQAVVTLNGRDVLLGKHGTKASRDEYVRITNEWRSTRGVSLAVAGDGLSISELILAFWRHAEKYYRKDGKPTSELYLFKMALRVLRQLYGPTAASAFSPRCLHAVIEEMVSLGWCRKSINKHLGRIKNVFQWATSKEMIPGSVYHALMSVKGLKQNRSDARESVPVRPVPDQHVDAVLPHVSRQVKALANLQLLTGMRPGEACIMRGCDVDTTGKLWQYTPSSHKTQHHDHDRIIYLGPQAQEIVREFLKPNLQAYLFSPADAESERLAERHEQRKTSLKCGNVPGSARLRKPKRCPQDRYTVGSYRRAIERGCEIAFGMPDELYEPRGKAERAAEAAMSADQRQKVRADRAAARSTWRTAHCWNPHQLRHNAATRLRKDYGVEAAQVILGHKTLSVTQLYAEKNVQEAQRVMGEVG